jgi:hypothetical protein
VRRDLLPAPIVRGAEGAPPISPKPAGRLRWGSTVHLGALRHTVDSAQIPNKNSSRQPFDACGIKPQISFVDGEIDCLRQ